MQLSEKLTGILLLLSTLIASAGHAAALKRVVHNSEELSNALANAEPGETIRLADETVFTGNFALEKSGTSDAAIVIRGGSTAILDGLSISSGETFTLNGASYVVLDGFTVRRGRVGVVFDHAQHNRVYGVTVQETGAGAIQLRAGSSSNTVENTTLSRTGLSDPGSGHGVEVGSENGRWCVWNLCRPDNSDSNEVQANTIGEGVLGIPIVVREGTHNTLINSNTLSGNSISGEGGAHQFIEVTGDKATIQYNQAALSRANSELRYGITIHSVFPDTGNDNLVKRNTVLMDGYEGAGVGIHIVNSMGTKVCDSNTVHGADLTDAAAGPC